MAIGRDLLRGLGSAGTNLSQALMMLNQLKLERERVEEDARRDKRDFQAGQRKQKASEVEAKASRESRSADQEALLTAQAENARLQRDAAAHDARLGRLSEAGIFFEDPKNLDPGLVSRGFEALQGVEPGETGTFEGEFNLDTGVPKPGGYVRGPKISRSESVTTVNRPDGTAKDPLVEMMRVVNPQIAQFNDAYEARLAEEIAARYPLRSMGEEVPEAELQSLKQQIMDETARDWRRVGGPLPSEWIQHFGTLGVPVPQIEFDVTPPPGSGDDSNANPYEGRR